MVLRIKYMADWELLSHQMKMQINKDNIHKNIKIVDKKYKVIDKFILANNAALKYETPYIGPFEITQCCTNERSYYYVVR